MRICLSMIVKDEAPVIERCLASVRDRIDAYAIVDTGSTDGTQALMAAALTGVSGEIIERPWQDFSTARNQALRLAERSGCDFAFVIDADETLDGVLDATHDVLGYMLERRFAGNLSFKWRTAALLRLGVGWEWRGAVHEAPYLDAPHEALPVMPGAVLTAHQDSRRGRMGAMEKYMGDAALLRAETQREPGNTRAWFYLAQSYRDAGQLALAAQVYSQRALMAGWDEEQYYAAYQAAELLQATGCDPSAAYMFAIELRPQRAEARCAYATWLRGQGRHADALAQAATAHALSVPPDALFVDVDCYADGWHVQQELALGAWYTGERGHARTIWLDMADDDRGCPAYVQQWARNCLADWGEAA